MFALLVATARRCLSPAGLLLATLTFFGVMLQAKAGYHHLGLAFQTALEHSAQLPWAHLMAFTLAALGSSALFWPLILLALDKPKTPWYRLRLSLLQKAPAAWGIGLIMATVAALPPLMLLATTRIMLTRRLLGAGIMPTLLLLLAVGVTTLPALFCTCVLLATLPALARQDDPTLRILARFVRLGMTRPMHTTGMASALNLAASPLLILVSISAHGSGGWPMTRSSIPWMVIASLSGGAYLMFICHGLNLALTKQDSSGLAATP